MSRSRPRTVGLFLDGQKHVRIVGKNLSGFGTLIRLHRCQDVLIEGCTLRNPLGPADPDGQAIQLDKCRNVVIAGNRLEADPGRSNVEDWISIYNSEDVCVYSNRIVGGAGSKSGTGICVDGDYCRTVYTCDNTLIGCGAVGIMVAGGRCVVVRHNRILDTFIPDPEAGNVGIAVMKCYRRPPRDVELWDNTISVAAPGKSAEAAAIWDGTGKARIENNIIGPAARKLLEKEMQA